MKKKVNNKTTLVTVNMSTYFSAINYFQANENMFRYNTNNSTGSKMWTDKNNVVLAQRIVSNDEDDVYKVDGNLLTLISTLKN